MNYRMKILKKNNQISRYLNYHARLLHSSWMLGECAWVCIAIISLYFC